MSRIEFKPADRRIKHPEYGMAHSKDHIACDLARPEAELRAIAVLMNVVPWIDGATVQDGVLYLGNDHKVPYVLQERALHTILAMARATLATGLAEMRKLGLEPAPVPTHRKDYQSSPRCAYASTRKSGYFDMPPSEYCPGLVLVEEEGEQLGYFLSYSYHDRETAPLAAAMLAMTMPEAGVGKVRLLSYQEFPVARDVPGIRDMGSAAYRVAKGMTAQIKRQATALQFEGMPSAFTDEDDDARDVLLSQVAAGAKVLRDRIEDADGYDANAKWRYALEDGSPLSAEIVERLTKAGLLAPEDGRYGNSRTLVAADNIPKAALSPRANAVPFQSFQSYCRYRRHPDDGCGECVHKGNRWSDDQCLAEACPILAQVYSAEEGRSFERRFDEDPAFNSHLLRESGETDPLMVAISRGTERSHAWKAAGQGRVMGVINQVLGAHFAYGTPLLLESFHERAIKEAVSQGWLAMKPLEALDGGRMGIVAEPTDRLLAEVAAMKAAQTAPTGSASHG